MLLLLSGTDTGVAMYRSILVFTILFAVVYLGIFFLNIIRGGAGSDQSAASDMSGNQTNKSQTKKEGSHG